ncbi:MAG: outer membrane protein assembly factor BamE [Rickettsiaceae bacterium]|nr:outer membrane protein assembly factor BamE [Rickettsiaceae bacterium]
MHTKLTLTMILIALLSACQTIHHSGTYISDEKIASAKTSNYTKENIIEQFGYPNIKDESDKNTWLYIHRDIATRAFFKNSVTRQRIVVVKFNHNIANDIQVLDDTHNKDFVINQSTTKLDAFAKGAIEEYISHIGKYKNTKNTKKNR